MRHALRQELEIEPSGIEPTWIAVWYADGSKASLRQADRYNALLEPDMQAALRTYLGEAG